MFHAAKYYLAALFLGASFHAAHGETDAETANLCVDAAHVASRETGVPVTVLLAISLTETGRSYSGAYRPWPWTVNMEGKGKWFDSREIAEAYVDENFIRGARNFDVGCFQINYRWHGTAFSSLNEMFEPVA
ncbi:MAG: lytic transglycosylase domain-containing protein, partial [Pseudomonadota bacterium]